MERLHVLGTGNASVTRCYNTCFALEEDGRFILTDAGGGNGILRILEEKNIFRKNIPCMILTHEHTDHFLGAVWMVRMTAADLNAEKYPGPFTIFCHTELKEKLITVCKLTMPAKFVNQIGKGIIIDAVEDGDEREMLGTKIRFFDIHSTKAKQLGYSMTLKNGKQLVCCGDEPLQETCQPLAENCDWMLHEAFCLYEDREIFHPYEKHHSTVKDAGELAEKLGVKNLVLWHTEDTDLVHRKKKYEEECRRYYHGHVNVPDDGDCLIL